MARASRLPFNKLIHLISFFFLAMSAMNDIAQSFIQTDEELSSRTKAMKPLRVTRKTKHDTLLEQLRNLPESQREIALPDGRRIVLESKPRKLAINEEFLDRKLKEAGFTASEASRLAADLWSSRDVVMSETLKIKK